MLLHPFLQGSRYGHAAPATTGEGPGIGRPAGPQAMTRRGQDARAPQMTDAQDSANLQNTQMHNLVAARPSCWSGGRGGRRRVALTLAPARVLGSSRRCWRFGNAVQPAEHHVPGPGNAAGPAGPVAAGDGRGELGAGSGRPHKDPIHPAPVGSLGGRCRPPAVAAAQSRQEKRRAICPVRDQRLIRISRQPVLLAANRCYLIQILRSALTCTIGCSCWSPDEENSPRFFLTMDVLCRLS